MGDLAAQALYQVAMTQGRRKGEMLLDVEELLLRVRKTLPQPGAGAVAFVDHTTAVTPHTSDDSRNKTEDLLAELRQLNLDLKHCADDIGNLPPSPPTLRGYIGRLLVRAVQRMLFWYIPSLRQFNAVLLKRCEEETLILTKLFQIAGTEPLGRAAAAYTPTFYAGSAATSIALLRALPSACLASLSLSDNGGHLTEILDEITRVLRPGGLVTFEVLDRRLEALRHALIEKGLVLNDSNSSNVLTGCKPT